MKDDILKALVTTAIFEGLEQQKRDELVRQAIESLLARQDGGYQYGDSRTKIQRAFDEAVYAVAREECRKAVQEDPRVRERIRELLVKGTEALLQDESVINSFASAISGVLSKAAGS